MVYSGYMALALSRVSATEHLNGVCEQHAINCLMMTKTHCIPGAGVMSMACRAGGEHAYVMCD